MFCPGREQERLRDVKSKVDVGVEGSKGFQHLEDTLLRSNDPTKLYHVTAMLWYHMKHRLFSNKM